MNINGTKRPAVFLDRDGTLIHEVNYLSRVEDLRLFDYTEEALNRLKDAGFLRVVVTNQSGIAREVFGAADMHAVHDEIDSLLNGLIDAFYHCPHAPGEGCRCRKPGLGMIEQACERFEIDLENSWIVGDKKLDVETGFNGGMRTALVMTGYGREHLKTLERQPDIVGDTLLDVVLEIVKRQSRRSSSGSEAVI